MKIGGNADQIIRYSDLEREPKRWMDLPHPIRILGNGSNTLIDDQGLKGSVVLMRSDSANFETLEKSDSHLLIRASAGTYLPSLAKSLAKQAWSGTEFMVGVPGTLGGAVVQNAGANEQEMRQIVREVVAIDLVQRSPVTFTNEQCQFSYRDSFFKSNPSYLIQSVTLELSKRSVLECQQTLDQNLSYRKQKTPWAQASLGSMYTRLETDSGTIYPGALIESCGLKSFRVGGAFVSDKHANYFINSGEAGFEDMYRLMLSVEKKVFEETGFRLQREIEVWSDRLADFS